MSKETRQKTTDERRKALDGSICPVCGGAGHNSPRYPAALCERCASRLVDAGGKSVELYNEGLSGGLEIRAGNAVATGDAARDIPLFVDGIEFRTDEARFGGVVVQPHEAWRRTTGDAGVTGAPLITPDSATVVRGRIVDALRRDLIGPGPQDPDLVKERLKENPSRWYLTGYLAPAPDGRFEDGEVVEDPGDPLFGEDEAAESEIGGGRAADDTPEDEPSARRTRAPSSCGLTVLVDASIREVEVTLSWGDYVTIPPVPEEVLIGESGQFDPAYKNVEWQRIPGTATLRIPVPENGRGSPVVVLDSAGQQRPRGALVLEAHARPYTLDQVDGTKRHLRALTIMVVNRRDSTRRRFADVTFAFQVRLEINCPGGLHPRCNLTGYGSQDPDAALADLHYRDVAEYAIGCNTSAGWDRNEGGIVAAAWTDFLPSAEVERVEANEKIAEVEFGMEALAELAKGGPDWLVGALHRLPDQCEAWIAAQQGTIVTIDGAPRQATASRLIASARQARDRIAAGIELLRTDQHARLAFRAMNEAIARAARQREAGVDGDPAAQWTPRWRPFQLAFILLNLPGLQDRLHSDRETVDLLFFPTGGGKTEAYLGLAAWTIAHRRITNGGTLGRRCRRPDALHPAPVDPGPAVPRLRRRLRAGADAERTGLADGNEEAARRLGDRDRPKGGLFGLAERSRKDR